MLKKACASPNEHSESDLLKTAEPQSTPETAEVDAVKALCSILEGPAGPISETSMPANDSIDAPILASSPITEKPTHLENAETADYYPINWTFPKPKLYGKIANEFVSDCHYNNYLRGCMWSPDGFCLLTHSFDNTFRIFDFPPALADSGEVFSFDTAPMTTELPVILKTLEHELVYDYCWFPCMRSDVPLTCCFVSTSRRMPVRLWDAYDGSQRAIYQPINHLGELVAARSVAFSANGDSLYCGLNRYIQIFRVDRPGVSSTRRPPLGTRSSQGGIFSALGVPRPDNIGGRSVENIYAVGTFCGTVVVYSEAAGGQAISPVLQGPQLGVSQVLFVTPASGVAPWYLIAGGRADGTIYVWDSRLLNSQKPLAILPRRVENYQRFQIDVDPAGRYLFTGNQTGAVSCYDLQTLSLASSWRGHDDSCHGISVHPYLPLLATSSGQKRPLLTPHLGTKRSHRSASDITATKVSKSASFSSSDSEDEMPRTLTEAEATAVVTGCGSEKLPMSRRLDLLPIRTEVNMWTFPLSK